MRAQLQEFPSRRHWLAVLRLLQASAIVHVILLSSLTSLAVARAEDLRTSALFGLPMLMALSAYVAYPSLMSFALDGRSERLISLGGAEAAVRWRYRSLLWSILVLSLYVVSLLLSIALLREGGAPSMLFLGATAFCGTWVVAAAKIAKGGRWLQPVWWPFSIASYW